MGINSRIALIAQEGKQRLIPIMNSPCGRIDTEFFYDSNVRTVEVLDIPINEFSFIN